MTTAPVWDGTAPGVYERVTGPGDLTPRRHAENPDRLGTAMCGERMPARPRKTTDGDCALCLAMINAGRSWLAR